MFRSPLRSHRVVRVATRYQYLQKRPASCPAGQPWGMRPPPPPPGQKAQAQSWTGNRVRSTPRFEEDPGLFEEDLEPEEGLLATRCQGDKYREEDNKMYKRNNKVLHDDFDRMHEGDELVHDSFKQTGKKMDECFDRRDKFGHQTASVSAASDGGWRNGIRILGV
ncbi:Protein of unknown function [Pyronema omphalodes CBS 100304]|uniref:Uncharacterized protein n=1 Tax=Pyronema omphalodes (strain CBS 100304) TaxID=1076935 RepID=U4LA99_PYROM|nr:Protein of unknown function [Pyronema omphalodes CBS 100304]